MFQICFDGLSIVARWGYRGVNHTFGQVGGVLVHAEGRRKQDVDQPHKEINVPT